MKCRIVGMMVLFVTVTGLGAVTFEDIEVWVGTGANRAALVIDWNDNPSDELVKVWGFRWDGEATGADMVQAVCAAESGLYSLGTFVTGKGVAFGGFGYNTDQDAEFGIIKDQTAGVFVDGYMGVPADADFDGWAASDDGDAWASGWFNDGFWGYYGIVDGGWNWPGHGASARVLTDGDWDGWSWGAAPGWYGGDPSLAVAVPEPVTLLLLSAGMLMTRKQK